MSLENWETLQHGAGNHIAARLGRFLRRGFGDYPYLEKKLSSRQQFNQDESERLARMGIEVLLPLKGSPNKCEMAFDSRVLFVPGSINASSKAQEKIFEEHKQRLEGILPGIKVIIGEDVDYIELLNRYFAKHGRDGGYGEGFGHREGFLYSRTRTPYGKGAVCVTMFDVAGREIERKIWDGKPSFLVGLTPIMVPA